MYKLTILVFIIFGKSTWTICTAPVQQLAAKTKKSTIGIMPPVAVAQRLGITIFILFVQDALRVGSCLTGNSAVRSMGSETPQDRDAFMRFPFWDYTGEIKIKSDRPQSSSFKTGPRTIEKTVITNLYA